MKSFWYSLFMLTLLMMSPISNAQTSSFSFPISINNPDEIAVVKSFDDQFKALTKMIIIDCAAFDQTKFQACRCEHKSDINAVKQSLADILTKYPELNRGSPQTESGVHYQSNNGIESINFASIKDTLDNKMPLDNCP